MGDETEKIIKDNSTGNRPDGLRNFGLKKYSLGLTIVIAILMSVFAGSVFGFMAGGMAEKVYPNLAQKFPALFLQNASGMHQQVVQEDSAVINVVKKASPAVVSIVVSKNPGNAQGGMTQEEIAGGSGFLVTADGIIVTNKHVVSDPTATYTAIANNGKKYPAKILATDPANDVALIKIDGGNFPTLKLGNSSSLQIGQTVVAIGNSLGQFSNTVSKGIVSGLGRNLTASGGFGESEQLTNIIQTDAAINLGNSGGPLLDIDGNVIGVNVAMAQGAQNIGFALPSDQIKKIILSINERY